MPRVYLKYDLPQEREEYELAYNGATYKSVIDDLDNWMRNEIKYSPTITEAESKVLRVVRLKLSELLRGD